MDIRPASPAEESITSNFSSRLHSTITPLDLVAADEVAKE